MNKAPNYINPFIAALIVVGGMAGYAFAQPSFNDLSPSHPNYTAIIFLQGKGIISGYPDGSFQPERTVNRAETLKMIILTAENAKKLTGSELKLSVVFPDIDKNEWYMPYLTKAVPRNIVSGYPDGLFRPEKTVNLVESLKMALKALEVDLSKISVKENPYADAFTGEWYAKYVEYSRRNNLIDANSKNMIYPNQGMKRGTLAEVLYRLLMRFQTGTGSTTGTGVGAAATTAGSGTAGITGATTGTGTSVGATGTIAGALEARVDVLGATTSISPYIYGTDERAIFTSDYSPKIAKPTFVRSGANLFTAYNWENNATNFGFLIGPNSNTELDVGGVGLEESTPAAAVIHRINAAHRAGAVSLITIPINDYVAADKDGVVKEVASDTSTRWVKNRSTKLTSLSTSPDLKDRTVYQDEFVNFIQTKFKNALEQGKKIYYSLDNEPGIWGETFPMLRKSKTTYVEMADRTKRFGTMIKRLAPNSLVFGPASYGFPDFISLNKAPDQAGREFLDFYLDMAKALEKSEGKRILDVLDIHWYPDVRVDGKSLTNLDYELTSQNISPSKAEIEARVQVPRSLWDPAYIEDSWVTQDDYYGGIRGIRLIPWLKDKIAAHYPGTKLAITEYNYENGIHISHAITQADVLGIFGREGVFAANILPLAQGENYDTGALKNGYITGAFDMYLDYDGKGSAVGDLSIMINNPNIAKLSLYAMKSSANSSVMHIIAINKTDAEIPLNFKLSGETYKTATSYRLSEPNIKPKMVSKSTITDNILSDRLPPLSVTTFELRK